jgi:glutathione S-transferase
MAPHLVLREAGFTFGLEKVDLATKQTEHGEEYNTINPKGYVPAIRLFRRNDGPHKLPMQPR